MIFQDHHPPQESGDIVIIVSLSELLVLNYRAVNKLEGQDMSSVPSCSARVLVIEKFSGSMKLFLTHKIAINQWEVIIFVFKNSMLRKILISVIFYIQQCLPSCNFSLCIIPPTVRTVCPFILSLHT